MPTNYPTGVDTWANPTSTTYEDAVGLEHDVQHAQLNDAVKALETKLGITATNAAANTVLRGVGGNSTAYGQVQTADLIANAVTASASVNGTTGDPTTSSGTAADLPEMNLTIPVAVGDRVLINFNAVLSNNNTAGDTVCDLYVAGAFTQRRQFGTPVAGKGMSIAMGFIHTVAGAGSLDIRIKWFITAGTATAVSNYRTLSAVGFRR